MNHMKMRFIILVVGCFLLYSLPAYGFSLDFQHPLDTRDQLIHEEIQRLNPRLSEEMTKIIRITIIREAESADLDPFWVTGIIAAESDFRPRAVSPKSAFGLMQITACVAEMAHITNPFDIRQNIYAGVRYLKALFLRFKTRELALAAYNAGPTRVASLGRMPRIPETVNYIRKVVFLSNHLHASFHVRLKDLLHEPFYHLSPWPVIHPDMLRYPGPQNPVFPGWFPNPMFTDDRLRRFLFLTQEIRFNVLHSLCSRSRGFFNPGYPV